MIAVCVKCGCSKNAPLDRCKHCGFDPRPDTRMSAQSIRLSKRYWIESEERAPNDNELSDASECIKNGKEWEFVESEIDELVHEKVLLDRGLSIVDKLKIAGFLLLLFVPGALGVIYIIRKQLL